MQSSMDKLNKMPISNINKHRQCVIWWRHHHEPIFVLLHIMWCYERIFSIKMFFHIYISPLCIKIDIYIEIGQFSCKPWYYDIWGHKVTLLRLWHLNNTSFSCATKYLILTPKFPCPVSLKDAQKKCDLNFSNCIWRYEVFVWQIELYRCLQVRGDYSQFKFKHWSSIMLPCPTKGEFPYMPLAHQILVGIKTKQPKSRWNPTGVGFVPTSYSHLLKSGPTYNPLL